MSGERPVLIVLLALGALGFVVYRATTAEERQRFLEETVQPAAVRLDELILATAPYRTRLRERTPRVVAIPVLSGLTVLAYVAVTFGDGSSSDPATLLAWGANQGPYTTNGQWWRLLTAIFVHAGMLPLLVNVIGLVQVGELLERLVGASLVILVYLTAGVLPGLMRISSEPLAVHVGASSAVFGLYGLLLAVTAWGYLRRSDLRIPLGVFQLLAPSVAIFLLYNLLTGGMFSPHNLAGFGVGLVSGTAMTMNVVARKPSARAVAVATAAALIVIVYIAVPIRGVVDVRPELARLVASEDRQAQIYRAAGNRFTEKRLPVDARVLTELIDRTILPQFTDARGRIDALDNALAAHRPLVASASEYLRLREASWRLRSDGWHKRSMDMLREAERMERTSLTALEDLRRMRTAVDVR